jgi:gliding motility associated protien GldN
MTPLLMIRGLRLCSTLGILCLALNNTFAQTDTETTAPPLDDITERQIMAESPPLKYAPLREADILWEKRIWRVIDTREKMNLPFRAPESALFLILKEAAVAGTLPVYSTEDDHFSKRLTREEVIRFCYRQDTVATFDVETGEDQVQIVQNELDWEQVKRFRIKEVWYFNSRTSALEKRILGIAPMIDVLDENGDFKFEQPLFWVYYPQARPLLAQHKVVTPGGNLSANVSWEDWMEMRHFSSMITKENNVHDLRLQDQYTGLELLDQSQRIHHTLFNLEHDMWTF